MKRLFESDDLPLFSGTAPIVRLPKVKENVGTQPSLFDLWPMTKRPGQTCPGQGFDSLSDDQPELEGMK